MSNVCGSDMFSLKVGNEDERENTEDELRLVLIGRTGSGKSASGNTILGRRQFLTELKASSVTQVCELGSAEYPEYWQDKDCCRRKKVLVVDMPGFGDTRSDPDQVHSEIAKCVTLSAPGPHAFLLVIQLGRYTEDEDKAAREMLQMFGESALQRHTVLVFTRGDDLEEAGGDMESFLGQDAPEALRSLVDNCGGRYHVLNNKQPENRNQVRELLRKVEKMVEENGGQCYTSAMFQEAERVIQEEQERLMREGLEHMEGRMMIAKRRRKEGQDAEEVSIEEKSESLVDGWGLLKEGWQKLRDRGRRKSSDLSFRREVALSPKVLGKVKVLVAAAATGLAVGAICGTVAPLALAAGASVMGTSVGLAAGIAGRTALMMGAAMGGVVGGAHGLLVGAEAAEPGEAALETLEQVGLMGAAVLGGAAFVGGAYGAGAGIVGAALEGGAGGSAALTGAEAVGITNAAAAAAPQAVGSSMVDAVASTGAATTGRILSVVTEMGRAAAGLALAGGVAVKVVKEKVRSATESTERKSYEVYWNK